MSSRQLTAFDLAPGAHRAMRSPDATRDDDPIERLVEGAFGNDRETVATFHSAGVTQCDQSGFDGSTRLRRSSQDLVGTDRIELIEACLLYTSDAADEL